MDIQDRLISLHMMASGAGFGISSHLLQVTQINADELQQTIDIIDRYKTEVDGLRNELREAVNLVVSYAPDEIAEKMTIAYGLDMQFDVTSEY